MNENIIDLGTKKLKKKCAKGDGRTGGINFYCYCG